MEKEAIQGVLDSMSGDDGVPLLVAPPDAPLPACPPLPPPTTTARSDTAVPGLDAASWENLGSFFQDLDSKLEQTGAASVADTPRSAVSEATQYYSPRAGLQVCANVVART